MTPFLLFLAAGCATQGVAEAPTWEASPSGTLPPPSLTLEHSDVIPGSSMRLTVTGAKPSERVAVLSGMPSSSAGPCPSFLGGDCLSIAPPIRVIAATRADSAGTVDLRRAVPSDLSTDTSFALQAVTVDGAYSDAREVEVLDLELVEDFSLVDVNTTSPTAGDPVSPRDYLAKVSGWYFGHAT